MWHRARLWFVVQYFTISQLLLVLIRSLRIDLKFGFVLMAVDEYFNKPKRSFVLNANHFVQYFCLCVSVKFNHAISSEQMIAGNYLPPRKWEKEIEKRKIKLKSRSVEINFRCNRRMLEKLMRFSKWSTIILLLNHLTHLGNSSHLFVRLMYIPSHWSVWSTASNSNSNSNGISLVSNESITNKFPIFTEKCVFKVGWSAFISV